MRYTKIGEISGFYATKNMQSLFVVFIASQANLDEFSFATTTFDMSFHTWLLIFANDNFCHRPRGNPFNLDFNSKMMVECNDRISEWYSLHKNHTEVLEVAEWKHHLGLIKTEDRYFQQRYDFKGKTLKIATVGDN